jgi:hypothetical protein
LAFYISDESGFYVPNENSINLTFNNCQGKQLISKTYYQINHLLSTYFSEIPCGLPLQRLLLIPVGFGSDESYLINEVEAFVLDAADVYGSRGKKGAERLVAELSGLFAGGEMADDDMDEMMLALQEAYWLAKKKNKKYTPRKYLQSGKKE